jgi:hypothetical protein
MHRIRERGIGFVTLIVGIGLLLIVAIAAVYLSSDVFRSKADAAYRQFAEWTPENIAKDPLGYLDFCEAETKAALEKLKATKIEIAQNRVQLQDTQANSEKLIALGDKKIRELLLRYELAEETGQWPLEWSGSKLDKPAADRQLTKLDRDITGQKEIAKAAANGLVQLDKESARVDELTTKAREQLDTLKVKRQTVKIQQISDSLRDQLVNIGAMVRTTVEEADSPTEPISLEELAEREEPQAEENVYERVRAAYGNG